MGKENGRETKANRTLMQNENEKETRVLRKHFPSVTYYDRQGRCEGVLKNQEIDLTF